MRAINYASIVFFTTLLLFLLAVNSHANITVMVVDTGIDVKHPAFSGRTIKYMRDEDIRDRDGHGTHVASLVLNGELTSTGKPTAPVCAEVELITCNYFEFKREGRQIDCFKKALDEKVVAVNFSSVGTDFDPEEYKLLAEMEKAKISFITAAGNESENLEQIPAYPVSYLRASKLNIIPGLKDLTNVIGVGGSTATGARWAGSNYGSGLIWRKAVNVLSAIPGGRLAQMTGTSQATALATNELLRKLCVEKSNVIKIQDGRPRP